MSHSSEEPLAVLLGGGANKSHFRAWDKHNIAVLSYPANLQPTLQIASALLSAGQPWLHGFGLKESQQ